MINDCIKNKTKELSHILLQLNEVQEFLKLKSIIENDPSLISLRDKISKCGQNKETKNILIKEYNSHPLVVNFNSSKEEVSSILREIQEILSD